jgi:hypothetical protein
MTKKQIFLGLTGSGLPKGELKKEMFILHNSLVGKSRYIRKEENPNTACGSCIQRVKVNLWKWYHFDESAPSYKGLVYANKNGIFNMPIYRLDDAKQEKQ